MSQNPAKHTEERNKGRKTQRKEEIKTEWKKLVELMLICFENNFLWETIASADYITGTESQAWQDCCQQHTGGNKQEKIIWLKDKI